MGGKRRGRGHQFASKRPLTTLLGQRLSGLLPFLMQSPLRTSNAHSCLGQVSVQPSQREVRDVGGLVRAAAVVDAPFLVGAVHEEAAAVAFHALRVADLEALGGHHVVPFAGGAQRAGLEFGQVHRQDDVHRPHDLGQAQHREGHQQRVQHLGRRAALAQRAAQVLAQAALGLRVHLADDGDQVACLRVELRAAGLEEGEVVAHRVGAGLDQVVEGVAHVVGASSGGCERGPAPGRWPVR